MTNGLDLLGVHCIGDDLQAEVEKADEQQDGKLSAALATAGDVGKALFAAVQSVQAAKDASREDQVKLAAAVAADLAATTAAVALAAAQVRASGMPRGKARTAAEADVKKAQAGLSEATKKQEEAAAAVPATLLEPRAQAAQVALDAANVALRAAPKSAQAQSFAKAWQETLAKAQNALITRGGGPAQAGAPSRPGAKEELKTTGFFERKLGPFTVKQYAMGGGVAAALMALGVYLRKRAA